MSTRIGPLEIVKQFQTELKYSRTPRASLYPRRRGRRSAWKCNRVNSFLSLVGLDNKYTSRCSERARRLIRFVPDKDTSLIIRNISFVSSALSVRPSVSLRTDSRALARGERVGSALINRRGGINWISGVNVNNRGSFATRRRGRHCFLQASPS